MKYGFYRACITPPMGTGLAGYSRKPTCDGIFDDLYLQMLLLEDKQGRRLLLLSMDLIGLDASFVQKMRNWITKQNVGLDEASINFATTHTHCGPATCTFVPEVGIISDAYMKFLEDNIKTGLKSILADKLTPASLYCGKGACKLAMNRRLAVEVEKDGKKTIEYQSLPNLTGSIDDELTLVLIKSKDREILIMNYACHPTTRGGYIVSGDYPSAAMRVLRANSWHRREAMFLQSGGGDLRVPCMNEDKTRFLAGDEFKVIEYGNIIVAAVERILKKGLQKAEPKFSAATVKFVLPFDKNSDLLKHKNAFRDFKKLAKWRLKNENPQGLELDWVVWRLSKECVISALPGEVCHKIGRNAKRISNVKYPLFLGYTNGNPAYIPTDEITSQRGYEGLDSLFYYAQPHPFKIGSEEVIYQNLRAALAELK